MKQNLFLGLALALLATLFYSALAAIIKVYASELPLPMLIFIQSSIAFLVFFPILSKKGMRHIKANLKTKKLPLHILRTFFSLATSYALFYSVKFIPLTNAMLLANTSPLMIPIISYLFLSHPINHRLWLPIFIGFIGIALVLQPNESLFHPAALLALSAAVSIGLSMILVRKLAATDSIETISFYFFLISVIISGVIVIPFWTALPMKLWFALILIGTFYAVSQFLYTMALRYANPSILGTTLYFNIINSAIISAFIWHVIPSIMTILGILLTVMGGIFCILAERGFIQRQKPGKEIADPASF